MNFHDRFKEEERVSACMGRQQKMGTSRAFGWSMDQVGREDVEALIEDRYIPKCSGRRG